MSGTQRGRIKRKKRDSKGKQIPNIQNVFSKYGSFIV